MKRIICKILGHKMPDNDITISETLFASCKRCNAMHSWYRKTGKTYRKIAQK